jgi:hypothetical protein
MLVVGTVLALINHGADFLHGHLTPTIVAETLLTYVVPYCVSLWGALSASRLPTFRDPPSRSPR